MVWTSVMSIPLWGFTRHQKTIHRRAKKVGKLETKISVFLFLSFRKNLYNMYVFKK